MFLQTGLEVSSRKKKSHNNFGNNNNYVAYYNVLDVYKGHATKIKTCMKEWVGKMFLQTSLEVISRKNKKS